MPLPTRRTILRQFLKNGLGLGAGLAAAGRGRDFLRLGDQSALAGTFWSLEGLVSICEARSARHGFAIAID